MRGPTFPVSSAALPKASLDRSVLCLLSPELTKGRGGARELLLWVTELSYVQGAILQDKPDTTPTRSLGMARGSGLWQS